MTLRQGVPSDPRAVAKSVMRANLGGMAVRRKHLVFRKAIYVEMMVI
jgi:hypothetical protein